MAQRFLPPAIHPIVIPLSRDGRQKLVCEGWDGPPPLPSLELSQRLESRPGEFKIESFRDAWRYASSYLIDWYGLENVTRMMEAFGWSSMEPHEEKYFRCLPDVLTLYRGGDTPESAPTAMSWTLGRAWAAVRIRSHQPAQLVRGTVRKADVLAFYISNIEVVVRPGTVTIDPEPIPVRRQDQED
jgi:hypothetical protein